MGTSNEILYLEIGILYMFPTDNKFTLSYDLYYLTILSFVIQLSVSFMKRMETGYEKTSIIYISREYVRCS